MNEREDLSAAIIRHLGLFAEGTAYVQPPDLHLMKTGLGDNMNKIIMILYPVSKTVSGESIQTSNTCAMATIITNCTSGTL